MQLSIEATPYFRKVDHQLCRVVKITLPETIKGPVNVCINAGSEICNVGTTAMDGVILVCGLKTYDRPLDVHAVIESHQQRWEANGMIPPSRPWTIYIAQDKHLDYGWIHPVEQVVERLNVLTDFALDHGMRWNFDSSIWVEEYIQARPSERSERLLDRLRNGDMEVAANWLVPSPGLLSLEEMVHLLDYSRSLKEKGVPVQTVLLEEVPSLAWGMASVLAEAGIRHIVKGAYDLRNPHLKERDPFPLAWWEGPDGNRVLLRWDCYADTGKWGGYGEGWIFWKSTSHTERVDYVEKTILRYEAYQHYPFNAILLAGTGFDEFPQTTAVSDFIAWFNNQGWDYPRLVEATWNDFWQAVELQLASAQIPVIRGDWGTAWEEWPAQIARLSTLYRRARQTVFSAQTMAAISRNLAPTTSVNRTQALNRAWRGLLQFTEHDFGGISADYAEDVYETKAGYAHTALREGVYALESGISSLAEKLPQVKGGHTLVVANPNNWRRGGFVEMVVYDAIPYEVIDLETNRLVPCQLETRGPGWMQHYLSFVAEDVPGFGYKTYHLRRSDSPITLSEPVATQSSYENNFYRLAINPVTGGLGSLFDKKTNREIVLTGSYGWNEYLHFSEGVLYRAQLQTITVRQGHLCDHLITDMTCLRAKLRTTYKLYHASPRLEMINELYKEASSEPQASWFAFPFNTDNLLYQYDGMAAILHPGLQPQGGDLLAGSGLSSVAVQSFLSARVGGQQIVLATPDAYLFQFGEQTLCNPPGDSDPNSPLALSLVMHNFTRNDSLVRQGGQEYFTFRYHISLENAGAARAVQFATEVAQNLPRAWVTGGDESTFSLTDAFVTIMPENIIATGFKIAEDGQGWALRLWESKGQEVEVTVDASRLRARHAWACNLLEGKQEELGMNAGVIRVIVPARGLKAIRFI
jgi:alpha-mannosidase